MGNRQHVFALQPYYNLTLTHPLQVRSLHFHPPPLVRPLPKTASDLSMTASASPPEIMPIAITADSSRHAPEADSTFVTVRRFPYLMLPKTNVWITSQIFVNKHACDCDLGLTLCICSVLQHSFICLSIDVNVIPTHYKING